MLSNLFRILILILSFIFGIICIQNPFSIIRLEAGWFRFASGNSFDSFLERNSKLREMFSLLDQPEQYYERFPEQVNIIRRTGYVAIFVSIVGACIVLASGFQ